MVLAQKIVSKAEGRQIALAQVTPSPPAVKLAAECGKDARLVELILSETDEIMRVRPHILIVRHKLGLVLANAGIDQSNVEAAEGPQALLLPVDPDDSAVKLRAELRAATGKTVAVLIIDSLGRAWRLGTTGTAIGVAGMPAVQDLRGQPDLNGRRLESSELGLADEIAAAASLAMGQAAEGTPIVLVRGLDLAADGSTAHSRPTSRHGPVSVIVALAGGVGGARLANGLAAILPPGELLVAVNTGDDFEHMGLTICPDIDTVTYTLAGLNDEVRGWGIKDETWSFMDTIKKLGGPDWFALGDRDLAKHVLRTERLRSGESLSAITRDFAQACGIAQTIVPMTNDPVRSIVETDRGALPFQDYFVRLACEPAFRGIRYQGAESARPSPPLLAALTDPALESIVICPSNPILSIGPILAVEGIAQALRNRSAPCIAVSPFVGGEAVKGPAAKIMRELGIEPGAAALTAPYAGLVDAILCDSDDPNAGTTIHGIRIIATDTLMRGSSGQQRLAREALALAARWRKGPKSPGIRLRQAFQRAADGPQ